MKIIKTINCKPAVSGNRNYFRRRLFLEDGGRIEIDFRMMSIPPFITDFKVWESGMCRAFPGSVRKNAC